MRVRHLPQPTFAPKKLTRTENEKGKLHLLRDKATKLPHTAQKRLPFKQFQVLLTPSSGFFSSFPHGTCSLSVSRPYLALDGTYHPLRAAVPSNSTLRLPMRTALHKRGTRLSLSMAVLSRNTYPPHFTCISINRLQFSFLGRF